MDSISRPAASDDIDVAALIHAIGRRKYWIAALAVIAGICTFISLSFVTHLYSSQARILIEREENTYRRPADTQVTRESASQTDQEAISSQVQVLLSRDLALGVVKELKLEEDREFNKDAGGGLLWRKIMRLASFGRQPTELALQERVLDTFLSRLDIYQIQKSRVIAVTFQSENPETAANAANKLAEFYLTWQQSEKLKQTREASVWLSAQIKQLTAKVEKADIAAERFRSSSGLLEGSNNTTLDTQELSELNSQLILVKAQRTEAEARAALIQKMLNDKGEVADAADVLKSRLIQRLLEQRVTVQRQLAEVSATLLPSHPRIKQLSSELADVRSQIRKEARKVVSSLQSEAQIAGARERSLRESLTELKRAAAKGNENQIKLRALEREAKANREVLESYLSRYRDASARSDQASVPAHASIVSRAHVSNTPSFPQKGPISLLVFAAVGLLGLAHAVARELIMPRHSSPYGRAPGSVTMPPPHEPQPVADKGGFLSLSTPKAIARKLAGGGYHRIIMSPAAEHVEASSRVLDTARAFVDQGSNTVLIDLMPEGDHIAIALDLPDAPGIYQLLSGAARFEDAVRRDPDSELHVISGVGHPGNAGNVDTAGLSRLVEALGSAYDKIVFYAAPPQARNLASIRSAGVPALVLVTDEKCTGDNALWLADQILTELDSSVCVITLQPPGKPAWTMSNLPFMGRAAAV